jgi:dolichol-phosphate mannosyltransferase
MTPTYNEAENITGWVERVRAALPEAHLMVIDDNSPDGTAELARTACAAAGNAHVVVRTDERGLGSAYRRAFAIAAAEDVDLVLHLDADLSHDPAALPAMVKALEDGADMVIGSRYVPGGATKNWPLHRRLLSRWGNRYTAGVLGLHLRDITSGFRGYRHGALAVIDAPSTNAEGYAFLTEMALRASDGGLTITEVPILFADRTAGTSKMSMRIISESMLLVTGWGLKRRWRSLTAGRRRRRAAAPH